MEGPESQAGPEWSPLPQPGCINVEGRVLFVRDGLGLAMLKFAPRGTIHEHSAPYEIDVVCLEGSGYISVADRVHEFRSGQCMRWPAGELHRLWTGDESMFTLMVERIA